MQGYPKHLNSRADYEWVRENEPDKWQQEFDALKTTAYMWQPTGQTYETAEQGVRDASHRVESMEPDGGYAQYEKVLNPNGKFFQLGFTEAELQA